MLQTHEKAGSEFLISEMALDLTMFFFALRPGPANLGLTITASEIIEERSLLLLLWAAVGTTLQSVLALLAWELFTSMARLWPVAMLALLPA